EAGGDGARSKAREARTPEAYRAYVAGWPRLTQRRRWPRIRPLLHRQQREIRTHPHSLRLIPARDGEGLVHLAAEGIAERLLRLRLHHRQIGGVLRRRAHHPQRLVVAQHQAVDGVAVRKVARLVERLP